MTNSVTVCKRIIGCQGSLQLITALSAVLAHADACAQADPTTRTIIYEDYLVIYDVSPDFALVIEQIATSIWTWRKITLLSPKQMQLFATSIVAEQAAQREIALCPTILAFREHIGPQAADEVYLVRNWQLGNQLLINAYSTATKIAYGDGIGYYFGPKRFQPAPQGLKSIVSRLTVWLNQFRQSDRSLPTVSFDCAYLLLPHIFKETPSMPFHMPDRRFLDSILQRVAETLPPDYRLPIEPGQSVAILLPGNFAQIGWTTRKNEFTAYVETLLEKITPESLLVVKPHPRNSHRDIRIFQQILRRHFTNFQILRSPISHIPMEVLLADHHRRENSVIIFGFTTACIPLAFLYGIACHVGFGRSRLERYFPGTYEHMWENETLLHEIVSDLSHQKV